MPAPLCAYCRERPVVDRWRPFCSERCKMTDLGRWLSGSYRVPVRQDSDTNEPDDVVERAPDRDES